jgi:hypothetical protein
MRYSCAATDEPVSAHLAHDTHTVGAEMIAMIPDTILMLFVPILTSPL